MIDERSFADKAAEAWGTPTPDWIVALAAAADRGGLKGAADAIGYTPSLVSTIIRNSYGAGTDAVEARVRGALLAATVECPVLGTIGLDLCLQEQAEPLRATSARRAILYHACRDGCPNYRKGGPDGR